MMIVPAVARASYSKPADHRHETCPQQQRDRCLLLQPDHLRNLDVLHDHRRRAAGGGEDSCAGEGLEEHDDEEPGQPPVLAPRSAWRLGQDSLEPGWRDDPAESWGPLDA